MIDLAFQVLESAWFIQLVLLGIGLHTIFTWENA